MGELGHKLSKGVNVEGPTQWRKLFSNAEEAAPEVEEVVAPVATVDTLTDEEVIALAQAEGIDISQCTSREEVNQAIINGRAAAQA